MLSMLTRWIAATATRSCALVAVGAVAGRRRGSRAAARSMSGRSCGRPAAHRRRRRRLARPCGSAACTGGARRHAARTGGARRRAARTGGANGPIAGSRVAACRDATGEFTRGPGDERCASRRCRRRAARRLREPGQLPRPPLDPAAEIGKLSHHRRDPGACLVASRADRLVASRADRQATRRGACLSACLITCLDSSRVVDPGHRRTSIFAASRFRADAS